MSKCADKRFYGHTQAALSQELALIQGPPGTGKTYVGIQVVKALLANTSGSAKSLHPGSMDQADSPEAEGSTSPGTGPCIGPVLIVCFTNHALDQFLEGLLAAGLTDMVRVGGRSVKSIWCLASSGKLLLLLSQSLCLAACGNYCPLMPTGM